MPVTISGTTGINTPLGSAAAPSYGDTTTTNTGLYFPTSTTLGLSTAGTTGLYIDASQNVGIGTTSPSSYSNNPILALSRAGAFLDIDNTGASNAGGLSFYQSGTIKGEIFSGGASYASWGGAGSININNYAAGAPITFATASSERMRIDSSGNVGIGTTSPQFKLNSVQGSGSAAPSVTSSIQVYAKGYAGAGQQYAGIGFAMNEHTNGYWGSGILARDDTGSYGSALAFYTSTGSATPSPTERMRIDSSGNLLVGTTSQFSGYTTNTRLTVSMPSGSSGTTWEHADSSGASAPALFNFLNNSNTRVGYIASNGTSTSFSTSSDYRLKENVIPMTTGLATIAALKPVNYDWISDKSQGEGFIAHELQAVIPAAVTGEKDAVDADGKPQYQGVDYSKIVVHLVAALQELDAKFDAYKASHP